MTGGDVLFLDPGADVTRRDIYARGRRLGMRVVLLNRQITWESAEVDEWIRVDPTDPEAVLATVSRRSRPAAIVNCSESCLESAARLSELYGLPGPGLETAGLCRDKIAMGRRLVAAGIPMARRRVVTTLQDAAPAAHAVGLPGVLKPSTGVASLFTVRFDTAEELQSWLRLFTAQIARNTPAPLRHMEGRWVVEEFLDGPAFSVESLVIGRAVHHIAVCEKGPIAGPFFREIGHCAPARLPARTVSELADLTERAIRALGIDRSVTHTEFKVTRDGPRLLEIATRMGGGSIRQVVQLTTGVDLVDLTLQLAQGEAPGPQPVCSGAPMAAAASRSLYPPRPGRVVNVDTEALAALPGVQAFNQWLRPGDRYNVPPHGYGEVCGIVTVGATADDAIARADAAIDAAASAGLVVIESAVSEPAVATTVRAG